MKEFTAATGWIPVDKAKEMRDWLLESELLQEGEVKLSSYRWADLLDHSKGYLCKVLTTVSLHIIE